MLKLYVQFEMWVFIVPNALGSNYAIITKIEGISASYLLDSFQPVICLIAGAYPGGAGNLPPR